MNTDLFTINCTGDVVVGDTVLFDEAVWPTYKPRGRFPRRVLQPLGHRTVAASVIKDSYGAGKQQHTFTLIVLACEGFKPLTVGAQTTRKARNVYREGTKRRPWDDESKRSGACDEKHARGDAAREVRRAGLMEASYR